MRIAVLVSGSGSLLGAMLTAGLEIALVASDRPCRGLGIAEGAGVPSLCVERTDFTAMFDRDGYAHTLAERLLANDIDLIAMAGFGTILGQPMFDAFDGQIMNTHPALLPAFPGWHAVRDALAYGVKVTGCTIHIATPVVDGGPILAQRAVEVLPDDDESTLHERIKVVERQLYVETLRAIIERGSVLPT